MGREASPRWSRARSTPNVSTDAVGVSSFRAWSDGGQVARARRVGDAVQSVGDRIGAGDDAIEAGGDLGVFGLVHGGLPEWLGQLSLPAP